MTVRTIEVDEKICHRCLSSWFAKVQNPKQCPKCKSQFWHTPRKRTGTKDSRNKYGFDELVVGQWKTFPWFVTETGDMDLAANHRRSMSLAQFMRRHDYLYEWQGGGKMGGGLHVKRRT